MAEASRKIVDILVLHHSCGPDLKNKSILEVQDWFDDCGRGWGYANFCRERGIKVDEYDTHHKHPRKDKQTYAQAQFALHEYKDSWRLITLMDDPFGSVAWGCDRGGKIDCRAISIEVCGNYFKNKLPMEALQVIVDGFIDHARNLAEKEMQFRIAGHRDFGDTECPGLIYEQLPTLTEMFMKALEEKKEAEAS
jgi:hypothetical protein